jgi:hypothetical protein
MANMVQTWASDVRSAEYGFFKAVVFALEQFQNKNNLPLTQLVAFCNGRTFNHGKDGQSSKTVSDRVKGEAKSLSQYRAPLKRILDQALSGTKLVFKDGKAKWEVSPNGGVNNDALEAVRMLAAQKCTVKGDAFKDAFPVVKKAVKAWTDEQREAHARRVLKTATEHGMTTGEYIQMLQQIAAKTVSGEPNH